MDICRQHPQTTSADDICKISCTISHKIILQDQLQDQSQDQLQDQPQGHLQDQLQDQSQHHLQEDSQEHSIEDLLFQLKQQGKSDLRFIVEFVIGAELFLDQLIDCFILVILKFALLIKVLSMVYSKDWLYKDIIFQSAWCRLFDLRKNKHFLICKRLLCLLGGTVSLFCSIITSQIMAIAKDFKADCKAFLDCCNFFYSICNCSKTVGISVGVVSIWVV